MRILIFITTVILFQSCGQFGSKKLPFLGRHDYVETQNGTDTLYHTIADFQFIDQDSQVVSNETFENKIYVADFFFTSCPSICPLTTAQMLRVYEAFENEDRVKLLSHSIDPEYDNVAVLKDYAEKIEVSSSKWHLVTGDKNEIYDIAQTSYYVGVREEEKAPGGFEHSGAFILVDGQRRIRGIYDGTDPEKINQLISDINILLENP